MRSALNGKEHIDTHDAVETNVTDKTLFPMIGADPFAEFLHEAQTRFPEIMGTMPLRSIYFTV